MRFESHPVCPTDPGGVVMGRSFESVRQGAKQIADRWARSSRALKKENQQYGERQVELAKKHSSEAFISCDDPLEAAVFSVLVETLNARTRSNRV
jgi:hypothetical protein